VPTYFNILTFVYNTNEIKAPPKTWEDLLDVKWKGKLALEDTEEVWLINFYKLWGEAKAKDYFARIGKQELKIVHGHSVMMQMMISGEVPATPTQYLHQAVADRKSGAPINFVIMDPMVVGPEGIAVLKNAPHPHAAMLFIDYATSKEGQTLVYRRGRPVGYPGVDPLLKDANLLIDDPSLSLDNFAHWQKLFKDQLIVPNKRR
jgi:iron(III) transport system substrate-binding protein